MTCPACGARNTADAPWCTQCLEPLGRDTPSTPTPTPPPASSPRPTAPSSSGERAFRTVDGQVEWRCPRCATWNPLAMGACSACGHDLAGAVVGDGPALAPRIAKARRMLWVAAGIGAVLMVVSVVLLVLAVQAGSGA